MAVWNLVWFFVVKRKDVKRDVALLSGFSRFTLNVCTTRNPLEPALLAVRAAADHAVAKLQDFARKGVFAGTGDDEGAFIEQAGVATQFGVLQDGITHFLAARLDRDHRASTAQGGAVRQTLVEPIFNNLGQGAVMARLQQFTAFVECAFVLLSAQPKCLIEIVAIPLARFTQQRKDLLLIRAERRTCVVKCKILANMEDGFRTDGGD